MNKAHLSSKCKDLRTWQPLGQQYSTTPYAEDGVFAIKTAIISIGFKRLGQSLALQYFFVDRRIFVMGRKFQRMYLYLTLDVFESVSYTHLTLPTN